MRKGGGEKFFKGSEGAGGLSGHEDETGRPRSGGGGYGNRKDVRERERGTLAGFLGRTPLKRSRFAVWGLTRGLNETNVGGGETPSQITRQGLEP